MFKCKRCHYTTPKKPNLKRHLMSKFECICVSESISREELLKELYPEKNKKFKCSCGKTYTFSQGLSVHKKTCDNERMLNLISKSKEYLMKDIGKGLKSKNIEEMVENLMKKLFEEAINEL